MNRSAFQQYESIREDQNTICIETREEEGIVIPVISDRIRKSLAREEGKIAYPLTNDRAFRGVVSYSEKARKGLASILLGKKEEEIFSAEILNPISFGSNFDAKKTEEDILMLINKRLMLDVEMQNIYLETNTRRFLLYLCRNFNSIGRGNDYNKLMPNVLVGIMNYQFEKERPEFYAEYRIINKKTGKPLFLDDTFFGFNVLDLSNSGLANDQDLSSGRSLLAALCKAATWEELRELGRGSDFAKEVAEIMYAANADAREQIALEGARRYVEIKTTMANENEYLDKQLKEKKRQLKETSQQLESTSQQLESTSQQLENRTQQLEKSEKERREANARAEEAERRAAVLADRLRQIGVEV